MTEQVYYTDYPFDFLGDTNGQKAPRAAYHPS